MRALTPAGRITGAARGTHQAFRSAKPPLVGCRRRLQTPRASAEAEALITAGRSKYDGGDRMGALKLWEQVLQQNPTQDQRVVALFNSACVHASFGDLELAQIPLKEAIFGGLDFAAAMAQQDERYVKMKGSAQVLIQLRKFNDAVLKAKAGGTSPPPAFARGRVVSGTTGVGSSSSGGSSGGGKPGLGSGGIGGMLGQDMSEVLSTDAEGIDASIGGIAKRVALLLVALSVFGTVLFFVGLKLAFPDEY